MSSSAPVCRPASKLPWTQSEPLTGAFVGPCQADSPVPTPMCPRSHPQAQCSGAARPASCSQRHPSLNRPWGAGVCHRGGLSVSGPGIRSKAFRTHSEEGRELVEGAIGHLQRERPEPLRTRCGAAVRSACDGGAIEAPVDLVPPQRPTVSCASLGPPAPWTAGGWPRAESRRPS